MKQIITLFSVAILLSIWGCSSDAGNGNNEEFEALKAAYVATYVDIVQESYIDAMADADDLQTAVDNFVANPTEENFTAAKEAWLDAREPYGQTEVYRFYDGPIDGDDGEPEGYINAWPLDEALIDYVDDGTGGQNGSTAINIIGDSDTYPTIDESTLRNLTGLNDNESNVTLGFHAIEFLLWGQDLDAPSQLTSGSRAYTDYTTADHADRRLAYLETVTEILVTDLRGVAEAWDGDYDLEFLALDVDEAISMILTGAAKLSKGELAGERMVAAVRDQDQENEHSCFSDNTHRDIYLNAQGINNVLNGAYGSINGTSIFDLLEQADDTQVDQLQTVAAEVMTKVGVIADEGYFDNLIIGETVDNTTLPVMSAVASLEDQGDLISAAAFAITGIAITGDLED